jgi:hypothetical protein
MRLGIMPFDEVSVRPYLGGTFEVGTFEVGFRVALTFNRLTKHPELVQSETIVHPTLFTSRDDAERFAHQVRLAGRIETCRWYWIRRDFSLLSFLMELPRSSLSYTPRTFGQT